MVGSGFQLAALGSKARIGHNRKCDWSEFEDFYNKSYGPLFSFVLKRTLNRPRAEDVVSEAFVRALRDVETLPASQNERMAWLYRVALNLIIDSYRRRQRLIQYDGAANEARREFQQNCDHIEDPVFHDEEAKTLHSCMSRLPGKYQEVLALRFFGEKTPEEISFILKVHIGTVKWRIHWAIKKLGRMMDNQDKCGAPQTRGGGHG